MRLDRGGKVNNEPTNNRFGLLKKNAQALSKQRDELRERDAKIVRLEKHVAQLKSWVEGSHMGTIIERSDGTLQLLSGKQE